MNSACDGDPYFIPASNGCNVTQKSKLPVQLEVEGVAVTQDQERRRVWKRIREGRVRSDIVDALQY